MELVIRPDTEAACNLVAAIIAKAVREKPDLVLGLATGRTMERLYARLAAMHRDEGLDFSRCRTFNLDEYIGLPVEHPGSYRYYMNRHLFNHINIDPANTFLPDGMAADIKVGCAAYEKKIVESGGIDLQLLGIGADGHIGFNEPLSGLKSRTRDKTLAEPTINVNRTLFTNPNDMPRRAITMGVGTILDARSVILLATGKSKADIIAKAVEGPITSMVTASALQLHQQCRVVVDEDAATELQHQDYYRWIFDHDPDWDEYRTAK
ncbi:MAG: glucosamine-6-phosphate deaminase [Kiritimatiellae bacterium]|nr:glucosamine-6-phosphate deaminase [Kiritimatiellia bacterium]